MNYLSSHGNCTCVLVEIVQAEICANGYDKKDYITVVPKPTLGIKVDYKKSGYKNR